MKKFNLEQTRIIYAFCNENDEEFRKFLECNAIDSGNFHNIINSINENLVTFHEIEQGEFFESCTSFFSSSRLNILV